MYRGDDARAVPWADARNRPPSLGVARGGSSVGVHRPVANVRAQVVPRVNRFERRSPTVLTPGDAKT
jgi:hypothetical protein